jgi:acyl carrier protein
VVKYERHRRSIGQDHLRAIFGGGRAITPETRFRDDLKADSLEVVQLIMTVEEIFNIVVADDAAEKLQTVGDLIDFLKGKQSA